MSTSTTQPRTGAAIFFDVLLELGVEYIFGHTGGAVIPLHVELNKRMRRGEKVPRFIMFRQEGGAGHAAEGYARVSGRTGVALATSITGCLDDARTCRNGVRENTAVPHSGRCDIGWKVPYGRSWPQASPRSSSRSK